MRNSNSSNRPSNSPPDRLDQHPKNIPGTRKHSHYTGRQARHGVASAGRHLPEWRNGNLQYPRRVFKRGMVFVFSNYRIGVVQLQGMRLRPT